MLFLRRRQLEGSCLHSQQTWVTNKKPLSLLPSTSLRSAATNYCGLRTNCPLPTRQKWLYTDMKTLQVGIVALRNGHRQPPDVAQCGKSLWPHSSSTGGCGVNRTRGDGELGEDVACRGGWRTTAQCSSLERITCKNTVLAWQIAFNNDSTY